MKCNMCTDDGLIRKGKQLLCEKHYRFSQMRTDSKRRGKAIPTYEELEAIVPAGMICVHCAVTMKWRGNEGRKTVATLQHYLSGAYGIICLTCNIRHAFMPEAVFMNLKRGERYCNGCKSVKPSERFWRSNSKTTAKHYQSKCIDCLTLAQAKRRKYPRPA